MVPIERIDEPSDPRVADYRNLADPERRARDGTFVAESRAVVGRLLASRRFRVRSILGTEAAIESLSEALGPASAKAAEARLRLYVGSILLLRQIVGFPFHRGCLAVAERGPETDPETVLGPSGARLLLVLEDVADPANVGAVFRNAMALGAAGVILSPHCSDPLYRQAIRASMGASVSVPFARLAEWPLGLARLREAGYVVMALVPSASALDIAEFGVSRAVPDRLALLVGTEGSGLSAGARAAAEILVRIRMAPGVDSLNLATACGIALHRLGLRARVEP